jgi:lipopolysaccharide/colanic/teichoic acid biosynthesis glycosyltransferase
MRVHSPTSRSGSRIYLSIWDLSWALTAPILALYLRDPNVIFNSDASALTYWVLSAAFSVLALFAFRLQDGMTRYFSVHEALDIAEAVLFAELMTFAVLFTLTHLDGIPRSMPLIHGLLLATGLLAARVVVRIVTNDADDKTAEHGCRRERIILIGANRFAGSFIQLLRSYAPNQQPVIAVLDENAAMVGRAISGVQVLGAPHELEAVISEFAVHGVGTDRIVIAGEVNFLSPAVMHEVERICRKRQIDLTFLPRMIGLTEWKASKPAVRFEAADTKSSVPAFTPPPFFRLKRWIDVLGSLVLMALAFPLLLIGGLLVLLDVGPPIFFWQERLGWKGRSFLIYKFRTLSAPFDSAGNASFGDRQPSVIGRFLRATRIDELPQLLNVLFGDMSLIGPRPLLPEDQPANTSIRLSVRPGISGWAQVNGAKLVTKDEKERLDEWYVRHASLSMDLRIIMMTLGVVLRGRVSTQEMLADTEQVQSKNVGLEANLEANRDEGRHAYGVAGSVRTTDMVRP